MQKRRSKRITFRLKAERISGDTNFAVFIENLSENGIFLITTPADKPVNFTPKMPLNLKLYLSSGEAISLDCRIIWAHKNPPDDLTNSIGLEIINPPHEYIKFYKSLH